MHRIRSVLFVGRAEALRAEAVAESPHLDVAWARDAEEAAALPLSAFDALVVDARDDAEARDALGRLGATSPSPRPPILVRVPTTSTTNELVLRSLGAAAVFARGGPAGSDRALEAWLDAIELPGAGGAPRAEEGTRPTLLARSPAMREVLLLVERAAASYATVLLSGETGTGKEVIARAIHDGSPRSRGAFVAVNCAAFPESLLESELFGYVKGAFTGADKNQPGLFEAAHGGTLFLDEIGETTPGLQAKLLRVLQEREVRPVGGARARKVDVRLVAATNRALDDEVVRGRFREDLYYRLAVFRIAVPPLRDRLEDVVPLAQHFLRRHGAREGKRGCHLSREVADLLLAHPWPGNVRELENEMHHALALAESAETISLRHLSERLHATLRPIEEASREADARETLRAQLARVEAWLIRRSLDAHAGRRAATARTLGITREGLYKKMRRFGIA
jgi:transcriptional regulator with PAS, ATPase and Fis domain